MEDCGKIIQETFDLAMKVQRLHKDGSAIGLRKRAMTRDELKDYFPTLPMGPGPSVSSLIKQQAVRSLPRIHRENGAKRYEWVTRTSKGE